MKYEKMHWNKENIYKYISSHSEIKTRSDLKKYKPGLFKAALRLNIIDDIFPSIKKNVWTKENIYKLLTEHPEIDSRCKLRRLYSAAYLKARKYGILESLFGPKKIEIRDTEESIRNYLKEHPEIDSIRKFHCCASGAYNNARKLGILETLFTRKRHKPFTKEEVAFLASKCKYRGEFQKKYPSAYNVSKKKGWYDEITSHMPEQKSEDTSFYTSRVIYVYEENITHSAYIGLTNNPKKRDEIHKIPRNNGKYDSLAEYCMKHNVDIPEMKILKSNLSPSQAKNYEKKYWYEYKQNGWNMINSEEKLGILGGTPSKWSYESLKELIKNENIKSRSELRKISEGAYEYAKRTNLLKIVFPDRLLNYWSKDEILSFLKEHPEINSRKEFATANGSAYTAANRLGIMNLLFNKKLAEPWNEESIKTFVSNNNIHSRQELKKKSVSAYQYALRKDNLLEILFGKKKVWTEERVCIFFNEHPEIKTIRDFHRASHGAYNAAVKYGITKKLLSSRINNLTAVR